VAEFYLIGRNKLFRAIRELQYTLLHLIQRVDELFAAIQRAIQNKLSVNLIKTTTLHNILQNVSLFLTEGSRCFAFEV